MDVGALLRDARDRAGLNQRLLAAASGASQSQIAGYESGAVSPTVATLTRLLGACGLQARVTLEPLLAELDARVDALLAGEVAIRTENLPGLIASLDGTAPWSGLGPAPMRKGPVTWAFDGHTALQLQALAVEGTAACLVVVLDEAARYWLRSVAMTIPVPWLEGSPEKLAAATREPFFTATAMLQIRFVTELPPVLRLHVPWSEDPIPVTTVDEVEQHWPEHAEVLARLRVRRSLAS